MAFRFALLLLLLPVLHVVSFDELDSFELPISEPTCPPWTPIHALHQLLTTKFPSFQLPFYDRMLNPTSPQRSQISAFSDCISSQDSAPELHTLSNSNGYTSKRSENYHSRTAYPLVYVVAKSTLHVQMAIRCANRASIQVCPRSGGHSFVGRSQCPGVVLDVGAIDHVRKTLSDRFDIGPGSVMGEVMLKVHESGRWFPGGVCPGVGMGGFTIGGGISVYSGVLGLGIDQVMEVEMVRADGQVITASSSSNSDVFNALLGSGDCHFGVVTNFRVKTASSAMFDRSVMFRFEWPGSEAGEIVADWQRFDQEASNVWIRLQVNGNRDGNANIRGLGACFDTDSEDDCLSRFNNRKFFNRPGRQTVFLGVAKNALELHAFIGPGGGWSRRRPSNIQDSLSGYKYRERGGANDKLYQSSFLSWGLPPPAQFWQSWYNICAGRAFGGGTTGYNGFVLCQLNSFDGEIDKARENLFSHRSASVLTLCILGGSDSATRRGRFSTIRQHLSPYTSGAYVNYPSLQLEDYSSLYWGSSVTELRRLKQRYDPNSTFASTQPLV